MRITGLIILFFTISATLAAQSFEVKVRMNDRPVNLAYVTVNEKAAGMTDETGSFQLNAATLQEGDRISASYIGANGTVVIYSPRVARSGSCTIELTPDFSLDEVVVLGEIDGWDVFRKYTNIPLIYEKRHDTKLDFVFTHRIPDRGERTIKGEVLMNRENSNIVKWNYDRFAQNLEIQTPDDTTGIRQQLLTELYFTLQVANGAVFRLGVEAFRTPESFQFRTQHGRILFEFEHKGMEGDERIFLVTNEEYEFGSSRPLRYLFRVDNRSKNIRSSESIHVLPQSLRNQKTMTTYELYRNRYLKPRTAELESVDPDTGESFHLIVHNIRYNAFSRQERRQFYPPGEYRAEIKAERQTAREIRRKKRQSQEYIPHFY